MNTMDTTNSEYPQLQIFGHAVLSEQEFEYFKREKNEVKNPSRLEGIIGGVILIIGIVLTVCFIQAELPVGIMFSIMMLVMGGGFLYNAMTVRGNSEERFRKGEIRAAEIVIPNVYFLKERKSGARGELDRMFYYRRCAIGIFDGKQYNINLLKRDNAGILTSNFNSVTKQLEMEAGDYIGKRCLAKMDYRRGQLFEICVFLDVVYKYSS